MLNSQGMWASPVRGAAGLSSGERWRKLSELSCRLRGTFFLLKMALHSWTEDTHFCRSKMGRCFPKPTYYSCPPLAVERPERVLSASSLLSSVLWAESVVHRHQGLQWPATKRYLRRQVYVSEAPPTSLLTPVHPLMFGRALQICTGLEATRDCLPSLSGQLKLGKTQKLSVWTKILLPAAPQIGGIDLERGEKHSWRCSSSLLSTHSSIHTVHIQWVSLPPFS